MDKGSRDQIERKDHEHYPKRTPETRKVDSSKDLEPNKAESTLVGDERREMQELKKQISCYQYLV